MKQPLNLRDRPQVTATLDERPDLRFDKQLTVSISGIGEHDFHLIIPAEMNPLACAGDAITLAAHHFKNRIPDNIDWSPLKPALLSEIGNAVTGVITRHLHT